MSRVITYANNKFQCFCQIKLDDGERILISIASAPSPSIKVIRLGFFGLWPLQTIWEYNPTLAGGYDAYVRKLAMMFQDPTAKEVKHPLDILRDRLLPCRSITAAQDSLFQAERSLSEPIGKKSETDRTPDRPSLSRAVEAAAEIVSAYGAVLQRKSGAHSTLLISEAELPFSKEQIKQAILLLREAIRHPESRTMIVEHFQPALSQYILSAQFEKALESGLVELEFFVPAEEARAEAKKMHELRDEALRISGRNNPK